ncbi:general secretion pathway protein GspB [Rudaea sp.]|uniref:general secretion pathway protein GspB n=1 Tax=Rudaea sp. TaxID=2136325 RepID=UPI0032208B2D
MSLILEALKKSEQQRRLGEMPNLGTPIAATKRRRSPWPWLLAVVVFALAAVGGWRYLRPRTEQAPASSAETRTRPITAATQADGVVHPPITAQRAPAPKPVAVPPPAPVASAPPPAHVAPAPPPAVKKEAAQPPTMAAAPAAVAAAPPVPPLPAPATTAAAPIANDVPTLDDLPADLRGALPALPITMQVYSPDPKRRFVIIDGARVVEGDSVRGVTVQEIRPAGLVLVFNGHRLLLPRPGS